MILKFYSSQAKLSIKVLYQRLIHILFCKDFAIMTIASSVKSFCNFFYWNGKLFERKNVFLNTFIQKTSTLIYRLGEYMRIYIYRDR